MQQLLWFGGCRFMIPCKNWAQYRVFPGKEISLRDFMNQVV
jgi:hypothetical protein